MVVELDEAAEANLTELARVRGVQPGELAAELVRTALAEDVSFSQEPFAARKLAVEKMLAESKGHSLGLHGMSMREFAHSDHSY